MSKKKTPGDQRRAAGNERKQRSLIIVATIVTILTGATMAGVWRNAPGARKLRALFVSPPPARSCLLDHPSKEYIYAGGKLVATGSARHAFPPATLVATTVSNVPPAQVTPPLPGSLPKGRNHYQVEKTTNVNTGYSGGQPKRYRQLGERQQCHC